MTPAPDLVIRNGLVVDGSGRDAFRADVAISGGRIQSVGDVPSRGREEIDATGLIVTPGFIDIHTHYDGQATWSQSLRPSTQHGVTTVIMGNCGVGFAPCRPHQRETLVTVMEGVEDIPEVVMTEGVPWKWETFPEYLDFIAKRSFDADVAAYVPHAAIRVFVMGERARAGEPATKADLEQMTQIVAEAVRAGAIGVATSRNLMHRGSDGEPAPHVKSDREELLALARGLRQAGRGVFQVIPRLLDALAQFDDEFGLDAEAAALADRELDLLREVAEVSGRPVTFSLMDTDWAPGLYSRVLTESRRLNAQHGTEIKPQVFPRPLGILVGLELSVHPFKFHPSYLRIKHLPLAERVARLREPEFRRQLLSEEVDQEAAGPKGAVHIRFALNGFRLGEPPRYTLEKDRSLLAEAEARGVPPLEVALDWLLEKDGKNIYLAPAGNLNSPTLENVAEMLADPNVLIGLGDGGAHYGTVCDAGFPTTLLAYWVRDRRGTGRLPLPSAINLLTGRSAQFFDLHDRGRIEPGLRADINLIDLEGLDALLPETIYDLPAGGRRVTQRAKGYAATIVAGEVTYRDGVATGVTPGRLIKPERQAGAGVG